MLQKKEILFFDNINLFSFIINLKNIKKKQFFFLKENLTSKILTFFFKDHLSQIKWNLLEQGVGKNKIITSIIENQEVGRFVREYLAFFFRTSNKKILDKDFYHYLINFISFDQNIIGSFSVQKFLISYFVKKNHYSNKKINFFFEKNIFEKYIKNNYQNKKIKFIFYYQFLNIFLFTRYLGFLKILYYPIKNFFVKKLPLSSKPICVIDSYEMNNPNEFFSEKKFRDKILFIDVKDNDKKNIFNIYRLINFSIYSFFFKTVFKYIFYYKNIFMNFFLIRFTLEKEVFSSIFKKKNVKVFASTSITALHNVPAVAAIHSYKGTSVGYFTSFVERFTTYQNIDLFNYFLSFNSCLFKKNINSNLIKVLNFGYVRDYKFKDARKKSIILRKSLINNGAKYIIGFFDQGSTADTLFSIGHEPSRSGYEFLLKKIISNPEFGLIIKPKKPKLLKEKLGKVYDILLEAQATKRCIVFENFHPNHVKNFKDIPAKIALASDLTIHDTLLAGTAGLESALCSKKSIFFDYYHSTKSLFLDKKLNIVYKDWDILWEQIMKDSNGISGSNFGNWSTIIDQFDSYRDGKANKRISSLLKSLIKK